MSTKRKVIARFSDGTMLKRASVSRIYTHAWRAHGRNLASGNKWSNDGFSTSRDQAALNMSGATSWFRAHDLTYSVDFSEIVAVEVLP